MHHLFLLREGEAPKAGTGGARRPNPEEEHKLLGHGLGHLELRGRPWEETKIKGRQTIQVHLQLKRKTRNIFSLSMKDKRLMALIY